MSMGVYIEGMEVPKDGMLEFVITDKGTVILTSRSIRVGGNEYFEPLLTPQELYRAVPVPPHGRLIDADALIEDLERQCKEVFRIDVVSPDDYWITRNEAYNEALWKSWVESFGKYLKTRPTIIPAEPGDDGK